MDWQKQSAQAFLLLMCGFDSVRQHQGLLFCLFWQLTCKQNLCFCHFQWLWFLLQLLMLPVMHDSKPSVRLSHYVCTIAKPSSCIALSSCRGLHGALLRCAKHHYQGYMSAKARHCMRDTCCDCQTGGRLSCFFELSTLQSCMLLANDHLACRV